MRITIDDVAREAQVSIATVSRFMNGRTGSMSEATRDRLQRIVDRLGYVPNLAAQSLKTGRSKLIGVVLANIAHPYWSSVLAGVEEGCQAFGYSVLIGSASDSDEAETQYVRLFLNQQVDGLLMNPASARPETIARWSALTCPVIMLDRTFPELAFPLVAMDNVAAARLAIEHLVGLGHRQIGFVSWQIENLGNRRERLQGYLDAMQAAGLDPDPGHIVFAKESWDDGVRKTAALLRDKHRPTAIFSASGTLNLQVLAGLKQVGLRVPDDVSVVGYDESPWDPLLDPPLTTVAISARRLGRIAAEKLCRAIERAERPAGGETRLKPRLIVRGSTRRRSEQPIEPVVLPVSSLPVRAAAGTALDPESTPNLVVPRSTARPASTTLAAAQEGES